LTDAVPNGLEITEIAEPCLANGQEIFCDFGDLEPKKQQRIKAVLTATQVWFDDPISPKDTKPVTVGRGENKLFNLDFTFDNFRKVFDATEFWTVLWVSIVYTIGGTGGALILGLFAAQLLMTAFPGRAVLRGLFLFPYVSPVIAVAFTWVFLLDPFSGTMNAILLKTGVTDGPINFLGQRGIALWTVIAFEAWRYFPLAFLFILARMQSLSTDLFLLRFIWTFNKFDDIFLLTGGASGTRTLTVNVYEQAFALSNLGAGAAVAVVIFFMLAIFVAFYFWLAPKEEGM